MKFISWNVNGLRACINKGFYDFFQSVQADFFCVQETKMQEGQAAITLEGYLQYWNSADRLGYSGTAIFTKYLPQNVYYGIDDKYNDEGRVITLEYEDYYVVNSYSPNSQEALRRLSYRMIFETDLRNYLSKLKMQKHVIFCGDLNVAHQEIDIKNPRANMQNAGFTLEEREKFTQLLNCGFVDTFRFKYPEVVKYTLWSYRFNARLNNAGWRIDYFVVDDAIKTKIIDSTIYNEVLGSDHCPIGLIVDLN